MKNALVTKIYTNLRHPVIALLLGLLITVVGCSLLVTDSQQKQMQQLATIMQRTSTQLEIGRKVQKIVQKANSIKDQTAKEQYIAQNVIKVVHPQQEEKPEQKFGSIIIFICCGFAVLEIIFVTICVLKKYSSKQL